MYIDKYIDRKTQSTIVITLGAVMLFFILSPIFSHIFFTVIALGLIKYGLNLRGVTLMQLIMKRFMR